MKLIVVSLLLLVTSANGFQVPDSDVRNCPSALPYNTSQPVYRMEVLPGIGHDNLRSIDMGQVHDYSYSLCKLSDDGNYLLPDSVYLIPVKTSNIETFAEYFDHWDQYTSLASYSIGAQASVQFAFIKVSSKFSYDYISTKTHMFNDNSVSTRVQVRHKLYTVKIQPDSPLHPNFKSRVFDIAANLQINNTRMARYLADMLVHDYGTHYIASMDAGAIIAQVDFIDSTHIQDGSMTKRSVTASASASFFGRVSLGAHFSDENSNSQASSFATSRTYSKVIALGGPPFNLNSTLEEWEAGVPDSLVAIDRSGDQLHFAINTNTVPELCETTVQQVSDIVHEATDRYFEVNSMPGCTQPEATNFKFKANVDDGSCNDSDIINNMVNKKFGGVFQNCSGSPDPNAACTKSNQCPVGYYPILIHSFADSTAQYNAYWCAPSSDTNNFFYFGGFYTAVKANPLTGVKGCPNYFYPQRWTLGPDEDVFICVSSDTLNGPRYATLFGGFESCETGNPLIVFAHDGNFPKPYLHGCPLGFTEYPIIYDDGCGINVCLVLDSTTIIQVLLPPFHNYPKVSPYGLVADTLIGVNNDVWKRDVNGQWINTGNGSNITTVNGASLSNLSDLPSAVIALTSAFITLILGAVIVLAFIGLCTVKSTKKRKRYHSIDNEGHLSNTTTKVV